MSRFYRLCWSLALLTVSVAARAQPLEVVASIKPLALIAERVAGPDAQVSTLLPAGVSPHEFALRVSDMRLIQRADLALWVGPELESFLQKPLAGRPASQLITAGALDSIHWPKQDLSDKQQNSLAQDHAHDHSHQPSRDPHVWLNPVNAGVLAQQLAQRLGQLLPAKAQAFSERAEQFVAELQVLDRRLQQELAPVRDRGFAVYHDGYHHFVAHYQLNQVDYVALTPEQRPGARHLFQLEKHLEREAVCLFVEPYADTGAAAAMAERVGLRIGMLDPLASDSSIANYPALMTGLAGALVGCLQKSN